MRQYQLNIVDNAPDLRLCDVEKPQVGKDDICIAVKSWSLNYRDLAMLHGGYPGNDKVVTDPPLIPLSDCAGEVVEVGERVKHLKIGDRVAPVFFQRWLDGELDQNNIGTALGGAVDGVLSEYVVCNADSVVTIPDSLSYQQAATLPCAAVTAWEALSGGGICSDQTVLLLGTGGVSIFALQLAKAKGARVILLSSSDDKCQRALQLGADNVINYQSVPDWPAEVMALTNGAGVDHVIEVGGAGTLEKSCLATRIGGRVSLIGVLTGHPEYNPSPYLVIFKRLTLQGVYVGSKTCFEQLLSVMQAHELQPVIDSEYPFEEFGSALEHLQSGKHFGKIVLNR